MPPAIPIAQATGTVGAQSFTFTTPATTKEGDSMIAILAVPFLNDGPDFDDDELEGWEELTRLNGGGASLWILRRIAELGDPGTIEIPFLDALSWGLGVIAVYRGLAVADPVGATVAVIAASTSFACPAQVLDTYSDLYLGIAFVNTAATAVTPPGGTTERHEEQAGGRTLEVFELLAEATGTTGVQTATTGAAQSGLAASIALATNPIIGFGKSFTVDPIGSIGLPSEGI